jgi:putative ABC transport system permease protein
MDDLLQDLRYAVRGLRRAPVFAAIAIATLAIGVGANTAVFSVVDAVVVRALPYRDPERLVSITGNTRAEFTRVRELAQSFSDVGAWRETSVGMSRDATAEQIDAAAATPSLFATLGVAPALGRAFSSDEQVAGNSHVALLSDGLWTRRFARDRVVLGTTILIEGAPYTIVGVMPPEFSFPSRDTQIWTPIEMPPSRSGDFWGSGGYHLIGRLRAGVATTSAQGELRSIFGQIRHENPVWDPGPTYGADAAVLPLQQKLVGSARTLLLLLLGVVSVVLLIACANVANLLLVRGTARRTEIAIRTALGGGRGRLVRQLLTESVVLAFCGGVAGVFVGWASLRGLISLLPADIPRVATIGLDMRVLAFTGFLVLITAAIYGLMPALRISGGNVEPVLRSGGRSGGAGASHRQLANLFVSGEIALAVVLVTAALLLVRSVAALRRIDPGFTSESIVTARISPPRKQYTDAKTLSAFYEQLVPRLRALPGVASVAAVDRLPMSVRWGQPLRIQGQAENLKGTLPTADHLQTVTPGYFATLHIPVLSGRPLTDADGADAPQVAVVSESFAKRFWPAGDAVGKRVGYPWPSEWMTIVGIVRDVKVDSLTGTQEQTIYRPLRQAPPIGFAPAMSLVVRTSFDVSSTAIALRNVVAEIDHTVPVSDIRPMSYVIATSSARPRFTMLLLSMFAGVALMLGVIGIYGVMSYTVAARTREIGVRMALGASPGDAMRMVLRDGMTLAGIGVVAGVAAALASTRLLSGFLYGVTATDPLTIIAAPFTLAIVALLASYLPARRATRVDPTTALRAD